MLPVMYITLLVGLTENNDVCVDKDDRTVLDKIYAKDSECCL